MELNKKSGLAYAAALLAAGVAAGYWLGGGFRAAGASDIEVRQPGAYKFINPLLECEQGEGRINVLMHNFRDELETLAAREGGTRGVTYSAVYFRDLNNGPWFGIRESEKFRPASLLKVPIAMALYKAAEDDRSILSRKLRYERKLPLPAGRDQAIKPLREIELGKEYTVEQLIEEMLTHSDNQALLLLFGVIPDDAIRALYVSLGVEKDVVEKIDGMLSLRSFATFYRILFNASFLSRKDSERVLQILSRSEYTRGLVAGVPPATVVSHKFGEGGALGGERQLQDCGIVYYPGRPYLLCVMAKGKTQEALEGFISTISDFVYKKVAGADSPPAN